MAEDITHSSWSDKSAHPAVGCTVQLRLQQLSEAAERETRLDRAGLGTMFVDNGRCICGEFLATCDEGDFVCIMHCCFRRIHASCLQKWGEAIRKARAFAKKEMLRYEKAEAVVRHTCDCGRDEPWAISVEKDVAAMYKRRREVVTENAFSIRYFERMAAENPRLIAGGEEGVDRNFNIEMGINPPTRLTKMAWKMSGPGFWLCKP